MGYLICERPLASLVCIWKTFLHSSMTYTNFQDVLGICKRCLHLFCSLQKSIWPDPSKKALGIFVGVRYWRLPAFARQVIMVLLRSLPTCQQHLAKAVHGWWWSPAKVCSVASHRIIYHLNRQLQDMYVYENATV